MDTEASSLLISPSFQSVASIHFGQWTWDHERCSLLIGLYHRNEIRANIQFQRNKVGYQFGWGTFQAAIVC